MRQSERGFSSIELIVATLIIALIAIAATTTTFQIINCTGRSNNRMTAGVQLQSAGHWISCDTQTAENVAVDNLEPPNFLVLTWAEEDYDGGDTIYHSVTYSFEDLSGGIGKLVRSYWSSAGTNKETMIAEYIYYDPADPANSSDATYQNPMLTVRLTALVADARETREYQISRRTNF